MEVSSLKTSSASTIPCADAHFTFYLQLYHDHTDAVICLRRLRRCYPNSRIILISDGDDDPRYPALAERFGCDYRAGERLYRVECGGRMVQRWIDAFLERDGERYLVKIDSDTRFHRPLRYMLDVEGVHGTLGFPADDLQRETYPLVQGGCQIFTRAACEAINASGLLKSDELLDYRYTYAAGVPSAIKRCEQKRLIAADHLVRYTCLRLGIAAVNHPEVCSRWQPPAPLNLTKRFAVTHPHKPLSHYGWKTYLTRVLPRALKARLTGVGSRRANDVREPMVVTPG